jgi:hypothetical protein
MIEVSEADRIAAADLFGSTDWSRTQYLTGKNDRKPKVQALAAHRQQAEDAMKERLASYLDGYAGGHYMAKLCADAIRGIDAGGEG